MNRLACLLISLVLHGGLVVWLAAGPGLFAPSPDAPAPAPDAVRVEMVPPQDLPGGETTPPVEGGQPPPAEAAASDSEARPPHAGQEAGFVPDGASGPSSAGEEVISPVKRNMNLPPPIHLGQGQIKTGKVTAMTLRRMAGYDFTLDEFCGHYEISGEPGRFVSVIDGRAVFGGLVMRDSATGMVRLLNRFSKFIFTYGPSFSQAEPASGSITFLARKEFERIPDVDERSRLLWQAEAPPARIAVRLDFAEKAVSLKAPGGAKREEVRGLFVSRAEGGPYPGAVVSFGDDCSAWEEFPWLARAAAARGLALVGLAPPGCGGRVDKRPPSFRRDAGKAALMAVLASFSGPAGAQRPWAGARAGLWGLGAGAVEVLEAAGKGRAAFVVAAPDACGSEGFSAPDTAGLARISDGITAPVLLVFFSPRSARDFAGVAAALRERGVGVEEVVLSSMGERSTQVGQSMEDTASRMFAVLDAALPWALARAR